MFILLIQAKTAAQGKKGSMVRRGGVCVFQFVANRNVMISITVQSGCLCSSAQWVFLCVTLHTENQTEALKMFSKRSLSENLKPRLKTKAKKPDKPLSLADWRVYSAAVAPGELHFPLMTTERHEGRQQKDSLAYPTAVHCGIFLHEVEDKHSKSTHLIKFDRMKWRPL